MQRSIRIYAMVPQPLRQCIKMFLAAVMRVCPLRTNRNRRFNYEITRSLCAVATKKFYHFGVNFYIACRVFTLGSKVRGCSDQNYSLIPIKRSPFKFIDFIASQSRHNREKKNFELLLWQFLLCSP